jgi:hypothetical protein
MRSVANGEHQLAGLFVMIGASIVFGPVIWPLERWREALSRDPTSAWGAQWLGEQLSAHLYLTLGALLLGVAFLGVLVMMILASVAKRLAARLLGRAHSS